MENEKFYTPEIEEFHVGFEYEFNDIGTDDVYLLDNWRQATIKDGTQIDDIHRLEKNKKVYGIRVKHLDREDIESLGWIETKSVFGNYIHRDKIESKYDLYLTVRNGRVSIGYDKGYDYWINLISNGFAKNKSELKRLMKQLNIE